MKQIHLNGFKIAGVGHSAIGTWRNPYQQEHRYTEIEYWQETARVLERGMFDSLFLADFPGLHDGYQGSSEAAFREAIAVPLNDPSLVISAMAAVTEHLGFAMTASTTYEKPYSFARRMTTLDHLTRGRVGWNIVTSASASAARNLGLDEQVPHDERYLIADEFMEVVYKLWEGSWEEGAVVRDARSGIHTDPSKIHMTAHHGKYYSVPDPFLCEPSPQRTPVLFQAGMSIAGRDFAAKHAEGVFLLADNAKGLRRGVDGVVESAKQLGRSRDDFLFLGGVSVVVAPTDDEAQAKFEQQLQFISVEGTLARQASLMQIDFGELDIDAPLEHIETDGIRSMLERYTTEDPTREWTPRQVAEKWANSLGAITIVGSPGSVADQLEELMDKGDIDGFNVYDNLALRAFPDFVDLVVPELQRRGRVRESYSARTLRGNLKGADRLCPPHVGAEYRNSDAPTVQQKQQSKKKEKV